MASGCKMRHSKAKTLIKGSNISVTVEDSAPGIILVSFFHCGQCFRGVLLHAQERQENGSKLREEQSDAESAPWDLSAIEQRSSYVISFGQIYSNSNQKLALGESRPLINKNVRGMRLRPRQTMCEMCKLRITEAQNESSAKLKKSQRQSDVLLSTQPMTVAENGRKRHVNRHDEVSHSNLESTSVGNSSVPAKLFSNSSTDANATVNNSVLSQLRTNSSTTDLQRTEIHHVKTITLSDEDRSRRKQFGPVPYRVKLRIRNLKDFDKPHCDNLNLVDATSDSGSQVNKTLTHQNGLAFCASKDDNCIVPTATLSDQNATRKKRRKLSPSSVTRFTEGNGGIHNSDMHENFISKEELHSSSFSKWRAVEPCDQRQDTRNLDDQLPAKHKSPSELCASIGSDKGVPACNDIHKPAVASDTSLLSWNICSPLSGTDNGPVGLRLNLRKKFDWTTLQVKTGKQPTDSMSGDKLFPTESLSDEPLLSDQNEELAFSADQTSETGADARRQHRTVLRINLNKQLIVPLSPSPTKQSCLLSNDASSAIVNGDLDSDLTSRASCETDGVSTVSVPMLPASVNTAAPRGNAAGITTLTSGPFASSGDLQRVSTRLFSDSAREGTMQVARTSDLSMFSDAVESSTCAAASAKDSSNDYYAACAPRCNLLATAVSSVALQQVSMGESSIWSSHQTVGDSLAMVHREKEMENDATSEAGHAEYDEHFMSHSSGDKSNQDSSADHSNSVSCCARCVLHDQSVEVANAPWASRDSWTCTKGAEYSASMSRDTAADEQCCTSCAGLNTLSDDASANERDCHGNGSGIVVGNVVWGKLRGCPWWPCRVMSMQRAARRDSHNNCKGAIARVLWFCSAVYSEVLYSDLRPFTPEFVLRFNSQRRGLYRHAVRQARMVAKKSFHVMKNQNFPVE